MLGSMSYVIKRYVTAGFKVAQVQAESTDENERRIE